MSGIEVTHGRMNLNLAETHVIRIFYLVSAEMLVYFFRLSLHWRCECVCACVWWRGDGEWGAGTSFDFWRGNFFL